MSLLDFVISFYRRHNDPAVQYTSDSAETTGRSTPTADCYT